MTQSARREGNRVSAWRSLIVGTCAAAALAIAAPASALTTIGAGAFSPGATTITFEDLPGDNSDLPAGYGAGSGVSFTAGTESEVYADYGSSLVTAATTAGLGAVGATWGCSGGCGTGFSLSSARQRVGAYLSSNVNITVQVTALRGGVSLGSQTLNLTADQIGFAGFEDPNGIDQIVIGDNTLCTGCIHQLDNVMFENASVTPSAGIAVPTLSQWATAMLAGLLVLASALVLRKRR